jgi:hypothetical protein
MMLHTVKLSPTLKILTAFLISIMLVSCAGSAKVEMKTHEAGYIGTR